jgi:diguanylate cyclase (GGDEF)-like protein
MVNRYLEWHTKLNGGYIYSSVRDITKKKINEIEQQKQFDLMNLLFTQSLTGIFFMMLEEPVVWNDSVNKEKVLDYVFEHQRITRVNQAMLNQYKAKKEDLIGAVPNILFRHDIEQGRRLWKKLFDDGHLPIESDEQRSDGSQMSVMGEYICLYDSMGRITGHFGTQIDVTERKIEVEKERQYQKALEEKNQLIEMIMDNAPIGIWLSGEELGSIFTNKFFKDHFNMSSEEIAICHMTDQDAFIKGGLQYYEEIVTFSDNRKHTIETVKTKVNGENYSNIGILGIGLDITERKEAEKEVLYLSYHDQLTGLYNRRFYEEELKRIDTQRNFPITLVMADLNGLKLTNDAFGHNAGDELLKTFSRVLQQECREDDIIARIGGDEFVILMPKTDSFEAEKIVHRINEGTSIQKVCNVPLSVSFGWQTKTDTNESFDQISKQAENLMYHKKLFKGNSLKGDTVKLIIETLCENVETERMHSEKVSQYCEKIGYLVKNK